MSSQIPDTAAMLPIQVFPQALLVTAEASICATELQSALQPYLLHLPVAPLQPDLTLAELVQRNAGGRRLLRSGTIARYLRAAQLETADGVLVSLGGPTLKRATGYGLQRGLVGTTAWPGKLREVTLSVRPLPAARQVLTFACGSLADALQLGQQCILAGLDPVALAFADAALAIQGPAVAGAAVLLAEFEGVAAAVQRQAAHALELARQAAAQQLELLNGWQRWEELARQPSEQCLDLSVPRASLRPFVQAAQQLAATQQAELYCWGDAGSGLIRLHSSDAGVLAALAQLAVSHHAAHATEYGWQPAQSAAQIVGLQQVNQAPARHNSQHTDPEKLIAELRAAVGAAAVLTRAHDLACYLSDASIASGELPLAVVLPASTTQVSAAIKVCAEQQVPVVARGAGSGLAGGAIPVRQGIVLALTRMQGLRIDATQQVAIAEAGVITGELNRAAEQHGLFYPPDPSSLTVSTIGGNIACNAGGPRCLKYGVTADYVSALTAVLADGRVIRLGDGLTPQSADCSLLHMLIGSEGTLAIITEATLRLARPPAARRTILASFARLEDACASVEAIMAGGVLPAGLELMDDTTINVVEDFLQLGLPRQAGAMLLLLADGEPEAVDWESAQLAELVVRGGAEQVQVARNAAEEAALWRARRSVSPALARVRPNKLGEDICVPVSRVAAAVRGVKAIARQRELIIPVFGHAGDGNLHPNILFDARDPAQLQRAWQAAEDIFGLALELGGTLSGEHGIGTLKRAFMPAAFSAGAIDLQRQIKSAFDPHGLLNPGKVLPDT